MKKLILTIAVILSMTTMAYAVPSLQLDISGGVYNEEGSTVEDPGTITSTGDSFKLYALAKTDGFVNTTYYISAAVIPSFSSATPMDLGYFTFGSQQIQVTQDMVYGTPPISAPDNKNLPSHSVFDTYFKEFSFSFTGAEIASYDSQVRAMAGNPIPTSGTGLYFETFDITTHLADGYEIHFDLYSKNDNGYLLVKAPFSHDAASGGPPPVPEPGTIVLLGAGFLGLAAYGRKRIKK